MNGEKLMRVSPSGESKTCIAWPIIGEIIAETYEQRGDHQPFKFTWFTILTTCLLVANKERNMKNYCKKCPVCLQQQSEKRAHDQEKNMLILDYKSKGDLTKGKDDTMDWTMSNLEYLRNGHVLGMKNNNNEQTKCK